MTEVTYIHPEGIKGAELLHHLFLSRIYQCRIENSKSRIKKIFISQLLILL